MVLPKLCACTKIHHLTPLLQPLDGEQERINENVQAKNNVDWHLCVLDLFSVNVTLFVITISLLQLLLRTL